MKAHHPSPSPRLRNMTSAVAPARAETMRAAQLPAASCKTTADKTPKSSIQGGISKIPARSKRAASTAAVPPAFPSKSSSTATNPDKKESVPGCRRASRRTASPAAAELASRRPLRAPASKHAAQASHFSSSAKPSRNQSKSPASKKRPAAHRALDSTPASKHSPLLQSGVYDYAEVVESLSPSQLALVPVVDLLADEDRFGIFRICAIMRDVCLENTRRLLKLNPGPSSRAGGRCLLISQRAPVRGEAAVIKKRKTKSESQAENAKLGPSPIVSRQALLASAARRIQRSVHLGFTMRLGLAFTHGAPVVGSSGMKPQHGLMRLILQRVYGECLRDSVVREVRMDFGCMLRARPVCPFISDVQTEARTRFSFEASFGLDMYPISEAATVGHDLHTELAIISYPECLEDTWNRDGRNGYTALHCALMSGHLSSARLLLMYRADVNARHSELTWSQLPGASYEMNETPRVTPLMRAAENGQHSVLCLLLEFQADIHAQNCHGKTALMLAASQGHESIVSLLIGHQADVNAATMSCEDDGRTALMLAASEGHESVVRLLVLHHADVNAVSVRGESALMESSKQGSMSITRLLIEQHADVNAANKDGRTAFIWSALGGHESIMRLLIDHQACITPCILNSRLDADGDTLLMWATCSGQENVVRLLLELRADVNAADASGRTAIMEAVENDHQSLVRMVLECGADVNAADKNSASPLYQAACLGFDSIVRLLLEHKADVNAVTESGYTPIISAAGVGHLSTVQLLIESKADVHASTTKGVVVTALTFAAHNCFHSIIRLLVDHQADVNAEESNGCTALMRACALRGQPVMGYGRHIVASVNHPVVALRKHETVLLLLQLKADVNATTKNGKTVLDYCSQWGSGRCEKHIYHIINGFSKRSSWSISDFSDERLAFGYQPESLSDDEYDGSIRRTLSDD